MLPAFSSLIFTSSERTSATKHALACNAYRLIPAPPPYDIQTTCHLYDLYTYPMPSTLLTYICELQYLPLAQFAIHLLLSVPLSILTSEPWVSQPQFLVLCWWHCHCILHRQVCFFTVRPIHWQQPKSDFKVSCIANYYQLYLWADVKLYI